MAIVNFENLPSENTPLTGGGSGNLNVMQENGTTHGSDTKLGYAQSFLNDHLVNVSNEVDEDYRVNLIHSKNLLEFNLSKYQTTTLSGVTNTDNGDQTITINGTQAQNTNLYLLGNGTNTILNLKANKTYTFKLYMISGSMSGVGGNVIIGITGNANYVYKAFTSSSNNVEIQITPTNDINITSIRLYSTGGGSGQTYTNLKLKAQINEGSTALLYEPYVVPSIVVDNEEIYSKASNTYSTSEINTGKKWINGKPIYRKVIRFNPSTSAMETKTAHNISNISEILPTSSCMLHRINNQFVPFSMFYPNTTQYLDWSIGWQVDNTHIFTWLGSSMRGQMDTSNYGAVTILEYTKTTD